MTCEEQEILIGAQVDGELDLSAALALESHIQTCAQCASTYRSLRALKQSLGGPGFKYATPKGLEKSIAGAVRQKSARNGAVRAKVSLLRNLSLAGAFAVCVLISLFLAPHWLTPSISPHESQLADEVVASEARSLMANHLVDVASTDQHTVKPWLDSHLDFGTPVVNLASQGFPLAGGRLDYMDDKPVAALVYRRFKHVVNVFVWPSSASEPASAPVKTIARRGYNIEYWRSGGMTYWAISDAGSTDIATLCTLIQQNTPGAPER